MDSTDKVEPQSHLPPAKYREDKGRNGKGKED
jgi:hypothetical protein